MPPAHSVLEFNDAQLRLHRPGMAVQISPVLAVADGGSVRVGDHAGDQTQVDARYACDSYLSQLGESLISLRNAPHLGAADLLYAHLGQLVGTASIDTFVVSPAFNETQLALVLGVALRVGQQPGRVLDAAVAAAAVATRTGEHAFYLDAGRTGGVLAEISEQDGAMTRGAVLRTTGAGLHTGRNIWLRWIRERCIALWRLDPMFNSERAAELVAAWPAARDALANGDDGSISIGPQQQLDWSASQVLARLADATRDIVDCVLAAVPEHGVLLLDARIHELPGLAPTLARYRCTRQLHIDTQARAAHMGARPAVQSTPTDAQGVAHVLQLAQHTDADAWSDVSTSPIAAQQLIVAIGASAHALRADQQVTLRVRTDSNELLWSASSSPNAESNAPQLRLRGAIDHAILEWSGEVPVRVNGKLAAPRAVLRAGDAVRVGQCAPFTLLQLHDTGAISTSPPRHGR